MRRIGRRGAALLFFALLDFTYCYYLLSPTETLRRSPSFQWLGEIMPLSWWAALWGGVGAVCLICVPRRRDGVAFAAAIALKVLWASVYLGGWFLAGLERAYISAAVWGAFAALVGLIATWPEKEGSWTPPSP